LRCFLVCYRGKGADGDSERLGSDCGRRRKARWNNQLIIGRDSRIAPDDRDRSSAAMRHSWKNSQDKVSQVQNPV
jgi:hypothetical protein